MINACKAEDISVPTQVAVVGVDNDAAQHAKCGMSISSVILNMRSMGRTAVRELDFLFAHPKWRGRPHNEMHFTSANQLYRIYKRHFGSTIRQDQTS